MSIIIATMLAAAAAQPTFDTKAYETKLDQALAAKDYLVLGELLNSPQRSEEVKVNLDWSRDRWMEGTSAIVPMFYGRLLWALTENDPAPVRAGVRGTAAAAWLYTYGVTFIDGARCGDRSAPAHRRDQLMTFIPGFFTEVRGYPLSDRLDILKIVVGMERKTAVIRDAKGDVEFLCVNGMEEMTYNLRHGSVKEGPPRPGVYGKNMVVSGDGTYRPSVVDEKVWHPLAEKARADLPTVLSKFLFTEEEIKAMQPKP